MYTRDYTPIKLCQSEKKCAEEGTLCRWLSIYDGHKSKILLAAGGAKW